MLAKKLANMALHCMHVGCDPVVAINSSKRHHPASRHLLDLRYLVFILSCTAGQGAVELVKVVPQLLDSA